MGGLNMKKHLAAVALAATLAQPAAAVTFPTLTTIYVAPGAFDDGGGANLGFATVVSCANVSGVTTNIRVLVLSFTGGVASAVVASNVAHGASTRFVTHTTFLHNENFNLATGLLTDGVINVESLQSAVFCSFHVVSAPGTGTSVPLNAVRVNPHPGTAE
jgi:hypothetical protein